ncbi:hypothetical protein ACFL0U_01360 [Pseudomonadota bacterium]
MAIGDSKSDIVSDAGVDDILEREAILVTDNLDQVAFAKLEAIFPADIMQTFDSILLSGLNKEEEKILQEMQATIKSATEEFHAPGAGLSPQGDLAKGG